MNISITNAYTDCLNFIETWINMILYQRAVYPKQCFHQKTAFQQTVYISKQGPLETYIGQFMQNLNAYEGKIKEIEIQILQEENGNLLQRASLTIQQFPPLQQKQSRSELKMGSFIKELQKQLKQQKVFEGNKYFQIYVLLEETKNKDRMKNLAYDWNLSDMSVETNKQPKVCCYRSETTEIISALY